MRALDAMASQTRIRGHDHVAAWTQQLMLLLQVIVGGLLLGAIYALFSSGLTLIWGMMNFINFAHGEFVMLGMYVALLVVVWLGGGPAVFGFAAAFALFVLGVVVYCRPDPPRHRAGRCWRRSSRPSASRCCCATRRSGSSPPTSCRCRRPRSAARSTSSASCVGTAQLVAGVIAARAHRRDALFLTRTTMGTKLLAVAEDRNAAMLMGIRPDRMQALAWGLSAGGAGIAGALMAISYPWSPSVGETFGLTAFVVVTLGGFGSVPGAMYAGLIIGLIQALSAFYLGADLQGHRGLRAVRRAAVVPAAGPVGQGVSRDETAGHRARGAVLLLYPFVLLQRLLSRHRRRAAARGDLGLGLEHRRRLCGAGLGRPLHVLRRSAPTCRCCSITTGNCRRWSACRSAIAVALVLAVVVGMPTFRLQGHYFSMATIAVAELIRLVVGTWDFVGAAIGLQGPAVGARLVGPDLPRRAAVLLHLPRRAGGAAVRHLGDRAQPLRLLSARHQGGRARRALARRAGAAHQALCADAERGLHLDRGLALRDQDRLHRSGKRASASWSRCRW